MTTWLTLERVKQALPTTPAGSDLILANIADAAEEAVERWCRRRFALETYDELCHGTGTQSLFLEQSPVTAVNSVRTGRMPALYVSNNAPSGTVQAATVSITDTGLTLTRIANAVTTTNVLTYAAYPTIPLLSAAVNALGNNWSSFYAEQFSAWSSADLKFIKGTFSARNLQVICAVFYWYLSQYRTRHDLGELWYGPAWDRGYENYLVTYTAGYDPVPEDLLQAASELAKVTYLSRNINPVLMSETLDKYSYTVAANQSFKNLSPLAQQTLNMYKIIRIPRWFS